jgi:hypothetical protein
MTVSLDRLSYSNVGADPSWGEMYTIAMRLRGVRRTALASLSPRKAVGGSGRTSG